MKNKIISTCLSAVFLLLLVVQPTFANTRLEDAQEKAQELISAQFQSEKVAVDSVRSVAQKNVSADSPVIENLTGSSFINPTYGRFTSKFGMRDIGSGPEFHKGVDIANVAGTNVMAAAAGIVTHSKYMNGYGNVVIIKHMINGQLHSTAYAHLSSLGVSSGQQVSQGESIGKMGNTGRSFGSHLHFEIHIGEWNGGRTNAVDPTRFINL